MVTDKERREVARRLRELHPEDESWWGIDGFDWYMFADYLLEAIGFDKDGSSEWTERLADLIEPSCDREALLALAEEMEEFGNLPVKHSGIRVLHNDDFSIELGYARRIREACGEVE